MTLPLRSSAFAAACLLASTQVVSAEITADDVWSNLQAAASSIGGTLSGTVARNGSGVDISGMTTSFMLPFGLGNVQLIQPELTLREAGDGTVDMVYPSDITYQFTADIPDEGVFSGTFVISAPTMSVTASGAPGAITYAYSADAITGKLTDWSVPEGASDELTGFDATVELELTGYSGTSTVTEGDLIEMVSDAVLGSQKFNMTWTGPEGEAGQSQASMDSMDVSGKFTMPAAGADIMNLAAAIQAGMSVALESTSKNYVTSQTQTLNGAPVLEQSSTTDISSSRATLDTDGLKISGETGKYVINYLMPEMLPLPVQLNGEEMTAKMELPLQAGDAPQPFVFGMHLGGLELSEQLWGMFDPAAAIPRDPADVTLDLSGTMRNMVDLLNIPVLMSTVEGGGMPAQAESLDINDITISAAGVLAKAAGALTFDNADLASYGGMPKPVGEVGVTLKGANGLIDTLVQMGLMTDQDAAGARMGMAMVARPDPSAGEDVLTSQFVFTEEGGILANGMQLK